MANFRFLTLQVDIKISVFNLSLLHHFIVDVNAMKMCRSFSKISLYRGGQRFAGDSDSPVSIVPHLKLIYVLILKEPYSIEKCATCLDTFLRF